MYIIETMLRETRFYVRVKRIDGSIRTMPRAVFVWLKSNQSFEEIPKGYVIHHLDYNPLNDDISNLALMQKHHHTAHHWKQKNIDTKITVELGETYDPVQRPKIYFNNQKERYFVKVMERADGKTKYKTICKFKGKTVHAEADAEKVVFEIWDKYQRVEKKNGSATNQTLGYIEKIKEGSENEKEGALSG